MTQLEINLLGTFQAKLDGEVVAGFRSDKTRALLAYLLVEGTRTHRRDWLATLLWGEFDDRSARRSLSSALANLRHLLAPMGAAAALEADRTDVWLQVNPQAVVVDILMFRELLASTEAHTHRALIHCVACVQRLVQATDLFVGPFLAGLAFNDSITFDEWQRTQQETLHQQALSALGVLTAHHMIAGRYSQAELFARRQIHLQPWHEEAHRQLMLALASSGQRNAAITQYELCRAVLAAELAVEPEEQTIALYHRIRAGHALPAGVLSGDSMVNPYRGLHAFRESDAGDFYGREAFTQQTSEAVQRRSLVALIGPSGSGKSSVLHAGVIHHLRQKITVGEARPPRSNGNGKPAAAWTICQMRPGSHPFHALAAAIAPHIKADHQAPLAHLLADKASLAGLLASREVTLAELVRGNGENKTGRRLLLVLDQFEELYTLCSDPALRQDFIDLLLSVGDAPDDPPLFSVLLAVRADFMGQMLAHRGLADALQDGVIMLGPMNRQELETAIVKPAQAQGMRLQGGLAARILNDVGQAPGRLPLLQFALTQLWERQMDGMLTHEDYELIGQVDGALAGYAEQAFALLSPSQQASAERVFTQMVQLGQDTEDTRRPITRAEVDADDWALVQQLADQRLVVTDIDAQGRQTAEIAHEALIHSWGRLRNWIDADRSFHLWQQRARLAADQWLDSDRDPGALLRGAALAEAEGWSAARSEAIIPRVGDYVAASKEQRQREAQEAEARQQRMLAQAKALADAEYRRAEFEAKANRRLRWLAASLSIVTLLAILAGTLAVMQRNEAEQQSMLAQSAQATADAERHLAEKEAVLARARQLAAQSINLAQAAPDLSILLSLHALRLNDKPAEDTELLLNLPLSPMLGSVLHDQNSSVYSLAVSPDSRVLASGGENGSIWLWDLSKSQLLRPPLLGSSQTVQSLAFSADGAQLASGDWSGAIRVWDVQSGQPIGDPIQAHLAAVTELAFAPDSQTLRSISDDGTQRTWSAASGDSAEQEIPLAGLNGMAFSADGSMVAVRDGLTLTVQSTLDGQLVSQPMVGHDASIHEVAFSPDGRLMASAGFDGIVNVWVVATGQLLYPPLAAHDGRVLAVAWSPDGTMLATGGTDARIVLWNALTGAPLGPPLLGHGNWVRILAWTPDGSRLISGDAVGRVITWDVGDTRWLPGHTSAVRGLAFSPDGRTLASGSFDQTVLLRDVTSGRTQSPARQGHENAVLNVAYSPDGSYLVSASAGGEVVRWNAATGQPLGEPLHGHEGPVAGLAISPDGRTIASGSFDNTIKLWDAATGEPLTGPMRGHTHWVISLAFSPDGRTLASASADNSIRLWDATTGAAIGGPLEGHTGWVTQLAWSSDGATLLSCSIDKTVRFWDVATGRQDGEPLTGHQAPVWSVMFNPADDGRSLYTGDNSGTVIWWDVATRRALAPPLRTTIETESMAISPDGKILAIGSFGSDGLVSLWALPQSRLEQRGCAIANRDLTGEERRRYMGDAPYVEVCPTP
jgi:WD40 repeat protein/DNA-binding SARP family transcriptional activator/energy-coupling factor transporter ATP-binding protein EcfA2